MALDFSEEQIKTELAAVDRHCRVAFAAACAERLFPGYLAFASLSGRGDASALRQLLDTVWAMTMSGQDRFPQLGKLVDDADALIPYEDEGEWISEQAAGEDAAAAVYYALRCAQDGDPQEAAWAGRRAYEAIDNFATYLDSGGNQSEFDEGKVLEHPLIQAELKRQQVDVSDLKNGETATQSVRDRAKADSWSFLPWYKDYSS